MHEGVCSGWSVVQRESACLAYGVLGSVPRSTNSRSNSNENIKIHDLSQDEDKVKVHDD